MPMHGEPDGLGRLVRPGDMVRLLPWDGELPPEEDVAVTDIRPIELGDPAGARWQGAPGIRFSNGRQWPLELARLLPGAAPAAAQEPECRCPARSLLWGGHEAGCAWSRPGDRRPAMNGLT